MVSIVCRMVASVVLLTSALAVAQESPYDYDQLEYEQEQVDLWHAYFHKTAQQYRIVTDSHPDQPLKLMEKPLLNYTDLEATAQQLGSVFMWCRDGRPQAMCIFWSATWGRPERRVAHEYQSLSDEPMTATIGGEVKWKPRAGGRDFYPVPDNPEVAVTKPLRTAQLQRLADAFVGYHHRSEEEAQLRRVTEPIYRYPEREFSDEDGAVFLYFFEQDPEMGLVIETKEVDGKLIWQYCPLQLTEVPARLTYQGEEVWRRPHRTFTDNFLQEKTDSYYSTWYERRGRLMSKQDALPAEE